MTVPDFDQPAGWPAVRMVGRLAVPGTLELSASHIRFRPRGAAAKVTGTPFSVQLRHVAAAGVRSETGGVFRRTRDALVLTLGDGTEHLFRTSDAAVVADTIRSHLPGGANS